MFIPASLTGMILSLIFCAPVFAGESSYMTEVINNVSIGDISIGLAEYELDEDGAEIPCRDGKCIVPGEKISRIVRISNLANPAWVRVKLEYDTSDGALVFPDACITPADERWIMRGDYYYLTVPLKAGEETDFMHELMIPPSWSEEEVGKSFILTVRAEAVQEANFTPDFTADDPWFGTLIETCVHTSSHEPAPVRAGTFSIFFEGGAGGLIKIGDDFFEYFGRLMPGDTAADMVTIKNAYSEPVSLFFRTEGIADDDLAKEAKLTIRDTDGVIFEGNISESREEVEIAHLREGEEEEIIYTLFIPPECDNSYALRRTSDKWIFRASLNTDEKDISSGKRHSGAGSTAGQSMSESGLPSPLAEFFPVPWILSKTGEGNGMMNALIILAFSGTVLLLCIAVIQIYGIMHSRR